MYEEDLNTLEDLMRRLKVEYDIFLNGNRKRPPDELRCRLEKLIKRLAQAGNMNFTERFQYNTLVARYYLYRDLWRRTIARLESGLEKEIQGVLEKHPPDSPGRTDRFQICIADPKAEQTKIRELYDALVNLGKLKPSEAPKISYEQFSKYVTVQTQSIRQKFGCSGVVFTLALEEDAIKFKAAAETPAKRSGA